METLHNKKSLQNVVPFLSGSKKYLETPINVPGPGSYLAPEDFLKPSTKLSAPFGTTQPRGSISLGQASPGPGAYNLQIPKKLSPLPKQKQKIIYSSSPSFPSKTLVFKNEAFPVSNTVKPKNESPLKGISFAKANRFGSIASKTGELGPGSYDIREKEGRGVVFGKSEKKYELGMEICKESYLKEEHLTSFQVCRVPKQLQNFGNRCERVMVEIRDSLGPGYYRVKSETKIGKGLVPFGSGDSRFRPFL